MPQLQDLRAGAREGTHLSRLGDTRSRRLFVLLDQAEVREEARRAVDRLRYDELADIAFSAAIDFIRRGYPGVTEELFPEEIGGACHSATIDAAETAVEAAGFDTEDAWGEIFDAVQEAEACATAAMQVGFEGGGREDYEMAQTFYGPPSVIVRRPVRSRSRASHGKPIKRRGSRRGAGCSTRAGPDDSDPHESDLDAATAALQGWGGR